MVDKEKEDARKTRCLMLNESKDILKYGSDNTSSKLQTLTFYLNDNGFRKCVDFEYDIDFILHLYVVDSINTDIITGVDRFEKCNVVKFDKDKNIIKIKVYNKEFFNMSQLKLLRKDKIGNILSEIGENESPALEI